MAGTKAGAAKAVAKILANDPEHFKRIGAIGGRNGTTGGFAAMVECNCDIVKGSHTKANCAGSKGGKTSRRNKEK